MTRSPTPAVSRITSIQCRRARAVAPRVIRRRACGAAAVATDATAGQLGSVITETIVNGGPDSALQAS